ncbi:unnamed protein product [Scytosiphon promiscuus]
MPSSISDASAIATATLAAVRSSGPHAPARRLRPRSPPLSLPLNASNSIRIGGSSRKTSSESTLENANFFSPWRRVTPSTTSGMSVPISMLLALLVVTGEAAPAAAAAAAAIAVAAPRPSPSWSIPSPSWWLPSASAATAPATRIAAFSCAAPLASTAAGIASARGCGVRPSTHPRRLRRRSSAGTAAPIGSTGRSRALPPSLCRRRSTPGCCWSSSSLSREAPLPPSSSDHAPHGSSRSGWFGEGTRTAGAGGRTRGWYGEAGSRRLPGSHLGSSGANGSGRGGAKEAYRLPGGGGSGWNREREDGGDFLSGVVGFSSGGGGEPHDSTVVAGGRGRRGRGPTAMASALSERDAARLKEVGIMVEELERDAAGGAATAGLEAAPAGALRPPLIGTPGSDPEEETETAGMAEASSAHRASDSADFAGLLGGSGDGSGGGSRLDNASLRMSCGDPVFFSHLAELIEGVHRRSGGRKFLTHAEEMELGGKVQRYRGLIETQEKEEKKTGRKPPLREVARRSAGLSEEELAIVMQDGMEARQKLVVCNLALVVSLSNKYKRSHFDCGCLQTLIQEGTIGLIRAAERYNPDKGFRFTTYAIWWIEARLRVSVQTEERIIHVPMWIKNQYNTVIRSLPKLRETLGREPTSKELAAQVEIDTNSKVVVSAKRVEQLHNWVSFHRKHESLDVPLQMSSPLPPDFTTIEQGVKASEPSTESTSELEIQRDFLESCLCHDLSRIQRKILRMKVGLGGQKGKNRQEISRALKIPFNSIISEERKAFYKLRGLQRSGGYPSFGELK